MIFDIDQTEGEWFQFFNSTINPNTGEIEYDDPVQDARVQIRNIGPFFEERAAKRKREVDHVLNPKTKAMERISYTKELSYEEAKTERDDAYDYAIVAFEGFKDKTGKTIKCTRENKLKMMRVPVFDRFVGRCMAIQNENKIRLEQEEKKT